MDRTDATKRAGARGRRIPAQAAVRNRLQASQRWFPARWEGSAGFIGTQPSLRSRWCVEAPESRTRGAGECQYHLRMGYLGWTASKKSGRGRRADGRAPWNGERGAAFTGTPVPTNGLMGAGAKTMEVPAAENPALISSNVCSPWTPLLHYPHTSV